MSNQSHARVFKLVKNVNDTTDEYKSVLLTSEDDTSTQKAPKGSGHDRCSNLQVRIEHASGGAIPAQYELLDFDTLRQRLESEPTAIFLITAVNEGLENRDATYETAKAYSGSGTSTPSGKTDVFDDTAKDYGNGGASRGGRGAVQDTADEYDD